MVDSRWTSALSVTEVSPGSAKRAEFPLPRCIFRPTDFHRLLTLDCIAEPPEYLDVVFIKEPELMPHRFALVRQKAIFGYLRRY